jgi:hypothetical protein
MQKILTIIALIYSTFFFASKVEAVTLKSFLIVKNLGDHVLVTDGFTQYMVEYDYNCYDTDFVEGEYMHIDTYYVPMAFDDIYLKTYSSVKTCSITDVDDVNINVYYVSSEIEDEDEIIVMGADEVPYLVEYGAGCYSMWKYVDEIVYFDIGGSYLDGIGDTIYLPNGDDCRVWDAEEIRSAPVYVPAPVTPVPQTYSCTQFGANAYLNTSDNLCYCKTGYQPSVDGSACVVISSQQQDTPIQSGPVAVQDDFVESQLQKLTKSNGALTNRLKGMILLQVEERGAAWYLHPVTLKRFYLKDGATAYEMLRAFGLGISEADFQKIEGGDQKMKTKLKGRILLRAQAKGEAYYINPKDLSVTYLQNGAAAYQLMRNLSQGITNNDIYQIPAERFVPVK